MRRNPFNSVAVLCGFAVVGGGLLNVQSPAYAQQLDDTCFVTVNGQTVQVNPDGTFTISNVPAGDLFGPGGPGTQADFLSDDFMRVTGVCTSGGVPVYVLSECFQITQGETFQIDELTFTSVPPLAIDSMSAAPDLPTLTSIGETTQVEITATLTDGTMVLLDPVEACLTFRTSNHEIVSIDQSGLATANGAGTAAITATTQGLSAVTNVTVSPGDPLTTVVGFVQLEDGTPVEGAQVSGIYFGGNAVTGPDGGFSMPGVATAKGPISVLAEITIDEQDLFGAAALLPPVSAGFTGAGIIKLSNKVRWLNPQGGSWQELTNWDTGFVPVSGHDAIIGLEGAFVVTSSANAAVGTITWANAEVTLRIASPSGNSNSVTLTVENGFTNKGTIDLSSDSSNTVASTLQVNSGTLLNAPGATIVATPGLAGGSRTLDAAIDNQGTIDIRQSTTIENDSRTFSSTAGTISVEPGVTLTVDGGTAEIGSATTFNGTGSIDWAGSAITLSLLSDVTHPAAGTGIQFLFSGDVTLEGPGTLINDGELNVGGDPNGSFTANTAVANHGMITSRVDVSLNGAVTNDPGATLRIAPCASCNSVTLTVENGFTNEGTIDLSSDSPNFFASTLRVNSGTLLNAPGATIVATQVLLGGNRTLDAAIDNQGTIDIRQSTTIENDSRTFSATTGTISVEPDVTLTVEGGTAEIGSGTTFAGTGNMRWDGLPSPVTLSLLSDVTHPAAGTGIQFLFGGDVFLQGPGTLINDGELALGSVVNNVGSLTANTALVNNGVLTTLHHVALNGALTNAPGATLRLASPCCSAVTLTVENGFTNNGIIDLSSDNLDSFGCILQINNGTLVNAPGATIVATQGLAGGSRTLDAAIDNQGTIDVFQELTIDRDSATHISSGDINVTGGDLTVAQSGVTPSFTNTGAITIGSRRTLAITNGSFINTEGSLLQGFGTLNVSGTTFLHNGVASPGSSPGLLTVAGQFPEGPAATINIEIGGFGAGVDYDVLAITGAATFDGTLSVSLIEGFVPELGDSFQVVTYGMHSGDLKFEGLDIPNGLVFLPTFDRTGLRLTAVNP